MGKSIEKFETVTRVGVDLAKRVIQVHAVDALGKIVVARALRRGAFLEFFRKLPHSLVFMETCASAHHWGREILALGHDVKLIPAAHVKPYVRRSKTDAADAAAICEASQRPNQRFVAVRSLENQAELMRHRTRELLVGQRTALINALRGHMAEIGVIAAQGAGKAYDLKGLLENGADEHGEIVVPESVCTALKPLGTQIDELDKAIVAIDRQIEAAVKADAKAKRLTTIPGIGSLTASAIVATVPDIGGFSSGREFAAFLGLTPRSHSSGGKERLGRISKMGDRYLRKLLVVGACAVIYHREGHNDALRLWIKELLKRKSVAYKVKLTAVALANKLARIVFALLTREKNYDDRPVSA